MPGPVGKRAGFLPLPDSVVFIHGSKIATMFPDGIGLGPFSAFWYERTDEATGLNHGENYRIRTND